MVAEKEDLIRDLERKVIINPRSKQLDVLEGLDFDYNFEIIADDKEEVKCKK